MILLDQYVNFIIDNKLTQEQFLFLELVYKKRVDLIKKYKDAFPSDNNGMISTYLLKDLINRGFLVTTKTGFKLGEKYLDVYINIDRAVDEIFEIYPVFVYSDKGVPIPLITMDKKVFREIYLSKIMGNNEEHKEVIKDLKFGIQNNLINMGINKFLVSEFWKSIRKIRIESIDTKEETIDYKDF